MDGERTGTERISSSFAEDAARFLKVVGNAQRYRILVELAREPLQVGDLEERLGLSQAYVSQQLARLRRAGIVSGERSGRSVLYTVVDGRVGPMLDVMHRFRHASQSGRVDRI